MGRSSRGHGVDGHRYARSSQNERYKSVATTNLPSVPFLKPMGKDTPDASSRWSCDSVVRAPMAPQDITARCQLENTDRSTNSQSARYWGEIVSSSSEPTGTPESVMSQSNCRAMRKPLLILKEPLMSGSLMRPFHPTVVRGFCGNLEGAGPSS